MRPKGEGRAPLVVAAAAELPELDGDDEDDPRLPNVELPLDDPEVERPDEPLSSLFPRPNMPPSRLPMPPPDLSSLPLLLVRLLELLLLSSLLLLPKRLVRPPRAPPIEVAAPVAFEPLLPLLLSSLLPPPNMPPRRLPMPPPDLSSLPLLLVRLLELLLLSSLLPRPKRPPRRLPDDLSSFLSSLSPLPERLKPPKRLPDDGLLSSLLSLPRLNGELDRLDDELLVLDADDPLRLNGELGLLPGNRPDDPDEPLSLSLPRLNGETGRLPVDELLPRVVGDDELGELDGLLSLPRLKGELGRLPNEDEPPGRKLLDPEDLSSLPLSRGSWRLPDVYLLPPNREDPVLLLPVLLNGDVGREEPVLGELLLGELPKGRILLRAGEDVPVLPNVDSSSSSSSSSRSMYSSSYS